MSVYYQKISKSPWKIFKIFSLHTKICLLMNQETNRISIMNKNRVKKLIILQFLFTEKLSKWNFFYSAVSMTLLSPTQRCQLYISDIFAHAKSKTVLDNTSTCEKGPKRVIIAKKSRDTVPLILPADWPASWQPIWDGSTLVRRNCLYRWQPGIQDYHHQ